MSAVEAAPSTPARPPPLFGFALYLAGTGCAFMGIGQLALFLTLHRWLSSTFGFVTRWGMPIGEIMIFRRSLRSSDAYRRERSKLARSQS